MRRCSCLPVSVSTSTLVLSLRGEQIVVVPFFSTVVLNNVDTMQRAQALEQTSGAGMLRCYVDVTVGSSEVVLSRNAS